MTNQSTSFWIFSNQLYDTDGVAEICLQLQADFELDVNLLLFCLWLAQYDLEPSEEEWNRLLNFSKEWKSHVVQPLRNTRQWMKAQSLYQERNEEYLLLREQIKRNELAAEKIQQEFIERSLANLSSEELGNDRTKFSEKRANSLLSRLLQTTGHKFEGEIVNQFSQLIKLSNNKLNTKN